MNIYKTLLLYLLMSAFVGSTYAADHLNTDSVWYDPITGTRTHLQRVDSITPYTCSLHFFGKKEDGSCKLPGIQALIEDLCINGLVLGWDRYIQDREWARVTSKDLHRNLHDGWVWDSDSFSGNQFSHPFHGSMFYNAAREHGLSYGVSLLYPVLGSTTWELFCETNRPAVNDLLSTSVGGAALGEVTHRVSDIFFDNTKRGPQRVIREVVGTMLNPVRGLHRIMSGEMFRVNRFNPGKKETPMPYSFQIGVGDRYIYDDGPTHPSVGMRYFEHVPFIDFTFCYGSHFNHLDQGKKPRAYDYFNLYALMNFSADNPTVGELDIRGRIGTLQYQLPHQWKLDIGFYQNVKYIDHFNKDGVQLAGNLPIISEAASFGAGFYAERQDIRPFFGRWGKSGGGITLTHDYMLNAVPLGGATADYFPLRRYNFGTGFSTRYRFMFTWNSHISFGNDFYFMCLFILKGTAPELIRKYKEDPEFYRQDLENGTVAWGDKGEQSVIQNRSFLRVNLTKDLRFVAQYEFNLRHGNYREYPSLTGKSHEWKFGLSYAL